MLDDPALAVLLADWRELSPRERRRHLRSASAKIERYAMTAYPQGWPGHEESAAHRRAREEHQRLLHDHKNQPRSACTICKELVAVEAERARITALLRSGRLVQG